MWTIRRVSSNRTCEEWARSRGNTTFERIYIHRLGGSPKWRTPFQRVRVRFRPLRSFRGRVGRSRTFDPLSLVGKTVPVSCAETRRNGGKRFPLLFRLDLPSRCAHDNTVLPSVLDCDYLRGCLEAVITNYRPTSTNFRDKFCTFLLLV